MRSVAWVAGLSVVIAYLLGTIPFGYLLTRHRLRNQLRRIDEGAPIEAQLRTVLPGHSGTGGHGTDLLGVVLDPAKVLAGATLAWHLVERAAPGFDRARLPPLSAVGFLADQ